MLQTVCLKKSACIIIIHGLQKCGYYYFSWSSNADINKESIKLMREIIGIVGIIRIAVIIWGRVVFEEKKISLHAIIHPPRLLIFQENSTSTVIPTSMFIDFAYFAPPPHLFQPPRLLERREKTLKLVRIEIYLNLRFDWCEILAIIQKAFLLNWLYQIVACFQEGYINLLDKSKKKKKNSIFIAQRQFY